jgi:predicted amidohydrolase
MATLRVALLQMVGAGRDVAANQSKGEEFCRRAAAMGADIALFPEMWSIGYRLSELQEDEEDLEALKRLAVGGDSKYVEHFRALARELGMAIAVTYLEKWPVLPRNTISLIDRHGEIRLTYAKVHTCDFDVECRLTPGDEFYVEELDTAAGPVKVGTMICFDREFPESARVLMLKGAEIILTPNACEMELNRLTQLRARAYENMLGIALANYAAPQANGHSVAYDGIAFLPQPGPGDGQSRDMLVVEAGEREGIYLAEFDLDALRDHRSKEGLGNAYRKPRAYGPLVWPEVAEPFIREDARR